MKRLALVLLALLWASASQAQYAGVRVVTTCGTAAPWPTLDTGYPPLAVWLSVDRNMEQCVGAQVLNWPATQTIVLVASHASTTALANNLNAKISPAFLLGFNCSSITGGAAGYCIAYNGASTPSTGALTGTNVLDFCYFDTTARGCSLGRAPSMVFYNTGIQILVSSAASPYTYTTGTDTAAITADYQ